MLWQVKLTTLQKIGRKQDACAVFLPASFIQGILRRLATKLGEKFRLTLATYEGKPGLAPFSILPELPLDITDLKD